MAGCESKMAGNGVIAAVVEHHHKREQMNKDALRAVFSEASRGGWSLRSDVQLQEWLEGFAERLKERTEEVAAEVHRLRTETGNVELLLQNNFNSLRALSTTQFIENRVDEVDEVFVTKPEQPIKQSFVEDSQIIPRYKEAVLTAWEVFEGYGSRKTSVQSSDLRSKRPQQDLQTRPLMKLPYIIGTEEFMRDSHCGLADHNIREVNRRAPSSEPVESGSDTDRDEARMAAEMVGERTWLEGESFGTQSETSGHQGGVLEPAVSAALDFKAMLEAALRGPSFPYDGGITPNLENAHEHHSYVDSTLISVADYADSNTPSTRSSTEEMHLGGDLSTNHGQASVEHSGQYQSPRVGSEGPSEEKKAVLLQPPPIHMPPAFSRNDFVHITGSVRPQAPSISTPSHASSLHSPLDGFPGVPEPSLGSHSKNDSQAKVSSANTQRPAGPSLSLKLRPEESKPQPASEFRPSRAPEDPPTPTLPDGLFQGLQEAIQARQLRTQWTPRNEDVKEVPQRPDVVGEGVASSSAEKSTASKLSPFKLNLKDNSSRGFVSKNKTETPLKLQKDVKGVSASKRIQGPISFQGGLFDDDDDDDDSLGEVGDILSKEVTSTPDSGAQKAEETLRSPLTGPLTSGGSVVRKGLFDDFGDLSSGFPREAEAGGMSAGLVGTRAAAATQQSVSSLPEKKDANRSRVLKKSLFGDSDEENDLFGE